MTVKIEPELLRADIQRLETQLSLRTDRLCVLEAKVEALQAELGAMAARAEHAIVSMGTAIDAANSLIAKQEQEIELLSAVEGEFRM